MPLILLLSGCALNPLNTSQATKKGWKSAVIVKYGYNISGAMIQITPHPTVNEITWLPEVTTTANLVPGKNYSTQVIWTRRKPDNRLSSGVDTIGWVGSPHNPYFSWRILQVADTNYQPVVTVNAITIERGKKVRP